MSPCEVDIADRSSRPHPFNTEAIAPLVALLVEGTLGDRDCEIGVLLTNDRAMRKLNREHRAHDKTTDVLSFPQEDTLLTHLHNAPPREEPIALGDLVISPAVCIKQAAEWGWEPEERLAQLVIHGYLHLLGYDHMEEADRVVMEAEEERLFQLVEGRGAIRPMIR